MKNDSQLRLVFVDDEPLVLEGLRRSLHTMRGQWTMEFANGGAEALRMMEQHPFDVVVTDMRMPGMDGAELLQEVKARFPQTIRIVLSGHSSRESLLRSIAPSHQSLSKPCTIEDLKQRIARAFALHDLLENAAIKDVISGLGSIPSLPAIYEQAVQELQSPDPSIARLAAIISQDAPMTAKILQLANSALLGVRCNISNAAQAVTLIGFDMIRSLVISVHIFSQLDEHQVEELDVPQLWRHSLSTASIARSIAQYERSAKPVLEDCFTAGLLHDIGKLILIASLPHKYKRVISRVLKENIPLLQAEQEAFNCTHAEVGAYLIGIWGLPHAIVEAVAWHHLPSAAPSKGLAPVTAVHVADALLASGEFRHLCSEGVLDQKHLEEIGLSHRVSVWRQVSEQTIETLKSKKMSSRSGSAVS
jgi:HD-like signal output (HDOD) protein